AAEAVVVDVEAGVEAEPPLERDAADEGAGRDPRRLQQRGNRDRAGPHPVAAVIANAVLVGVEPGEDARVRRAGEHGVRVREIATGAARAGRVEVRRTRGPAVAAQGVRAQSV